ncbi:MAG: hypothetical protein N3C60_09260 [Calditerrivibrio sp.]|nr:hypothetical protein [Calditerrivibrio sp.]
MSKRVLFFLLVFVTFAWASNVIVEESSGKSLLKINIGQEVTIVEKKLENNKLALVLKGEHNIDASQLWSQNINKIVSSKQNGNTRVDILFDKKPQQYDIVQTQNGVEISLIFPVQNQEVTTGGSTFLKMLVSIVFILIIILVFYWLIKLFMKKTYVSDIPGVGRSLGKIDIMPGKSIFFYEIKDTVYMFGLSGDQISLLDKITEAEVIDAIKAGFSKKQDFSSYLRFFGQNAIKEEIEVSSTIIKDKVESLKKRN